ncbi:hypothetical protein FKP32DRAFT_1565896, partial [Trametes sanguinea]
AILHTAVIWSWNSDLETGNFVPPGETAPSKIIIRRQTQPSNLCQFSYAADTSYDKSLYVAQKEFENHVLGQNGFNRGRKPRRKWQEGEGSYDSTYIFAAQVFLRRGPYSWKKERTIPYELHPWIRAATGPQSQYFANPDRPSLFEAVNGALQNIADCSPPHLQYGDLVWISFFVEFIVGGTSWNPTFVPVEIVRVGRVAPEVVGGSSTFRGGEDTPPPRQRLQVGQSFILSELPAATSCSCAERISRYRFSYV